MGYNRVSDRDAIKMLLMVFRGRTMTYTAKQFGVSVYLVYALVHGRRTPHLLDIAIKVWRQDDPDRPIPFDWELHPRSTIMGLRIIKWKPRQLKKDQHVKA